MFTPLKPGPWVTGDQITPQLANRWDIEHERALDPTGGGYYTLLAPLSVDRVDADPFLGGTLGGVLSFYGSARCRWRLDDTTINGSVGVVIDGSNDEYHSRSVWLVDCVVALNVLTPGFVAPRRGDRIRVVNQFVTTKDLSLRNGVGGPIIVALPAPWAPGRPTWADCVFGSAGWLVEGCGLT